MKTKIFNRNVMEIAKSPVITMSEDTTVGDAMRIMCKEGFRRIPIIDAKTKQLKGIVTASDILNFLGGGWKSEILWKKYEGNLRRALQEKLSTIMETEVAFVEKTATISEAIKIMKKKKVGGLPVVDEKNLVWAIITERDIVETCSGELLNVRIWEIMTREVVYTAPETPIEACMRLMVKCGFRRIPLTSREGLVGIITSMDILKFLASEESIRKLTQEEPWEIFCTPAWNIASHKVYVISPEAYVDEAARIMVDEHVGALLVAWEGKLLGIITERDLLKLV